MSQELRCKGTLHGILEDDHTIEVKCVRRICGHAPGVVVLHRFNIDTGEYTTSRFRDPKKGKVEHGSGQPGIAVRSA